MNKPVLILIDFERGWWERWHGKTRTLQGNITNDLNPRLLDWAGTLHDIRYNPQTLDPDHPAPEAA